MSEQGATRRFLLVPNHPVEREQKYVRIESAEVHLVQRLQAEFSQIGIAAFVSSERYPNLTGVIDDDAIGLYRLNVFGNVRRPAGKWLNYLYAAVRTVFAVVKYDFVYIFCPGHCALIAAYCARVLAKPYAFYVRGTWLDSKGATPVLWEPLFRRASFMVVTGEAFRRDLQRYCANVVNEVPLTALRPEHVGKRIRIVRPPVRLMFAGRLTEAKGILDVVEALALLRNEGLGAELVIAGGGTDAERSKVANAVSRLDLAGAVRLLGHVTAQQLAAAYEDADVFVFPSYFAEGFPRVLYEAMMFSMAIVTADMPGIRGFLVEGENCLYCAPKSPLDIARHIRRLVDDPELTIRLGRNARADVVRLYASFTEATHADQVLSFTRGSVSSVPMQRVSAG